MKPQTREAFTVNDTAIEQEIQAKGLTAPRVTPADLQASIAYCHYFTAYQGALMGCDPDKFRDAQKLGGDPVGITTDLRLLTFCVLVLRNGFTVTGESACASPENFDADIGRNIARANAEQKIWPLMGYALKQKLHEAK
jgi:hypothetical protein